MDKITQRQIIGSFYHALEQNVGAEWIGAVSNLFDSDQALEEYAWLGMSPAMREWVGGRNAKGLREESFQIRNKHFEATLEILVRDLRRDKTGQLNARIGELARRANTHWATLLSTLIAAGASSVCYDGQYFFDTDHNEGDSGNQSNKINADISAYPASVTGSVTVPSVEEMQFAIVDGITQIASFVDDQGEPMNEDATSFLVMVPLSLWKQAAQSVWTPQQVAASQSVLAELQKKMNIDVAWNARLSAWTDTFAIFRSDSNVKALIRQSETDVDMKIKGEGSEYEFDNDAHQIGIDAWRNVGYGYWQNACLVTMT